MTVNLSSFAGAGWQFFGNNGLPLSGGLLYTYAAGTSTPASTYTSNSGVITNTNPIVLDINGRVSNEVWLPAGTAYKFVLQDASFNQIGVWDNVPGVNNYPGTQSLGVSGYNELQNGFIQQWGSATSTGSGARTLSITLPIAFPNAGCAVTVTDATNNCYSFGATFPSNSTIGIYIPAAQLGTSSTPTASGNVSFFWTAVGY